MEKLLTQKQAIIIMIVSLIMVLVFHVLVLTEIIPYTIVWAGKIRNQEEMRRFEIISICVNSFLILIFLLRANYIQNRIPTKILNGIIWLLVILFSLNTIGNLFAKSKFELYFFTPLTFILAILCLRIVMGKTLK
jgi:hypothetical protein